jgi:hypothetical protein
MQDKESTEFTEREKFIVSFYRDPQLSSPQRIFGYDLIIGVASIVCFILFLIRDEQALSFVAFGLVLSRLCYLAIEGRQWTKDFQNIFAKYEAKLQEAQKAK